MGNEVLSVSVDLQKCNPINLESAQVNFIWRRHWNLGTWLYLSTRYLAFVDMTTMLLCNIYNVAFDL